MGSPFVDCGREAYIPWQMLKGEVLYRDIFNIYAPGAYYLNALLYKIFTPNLSVLYCSAFINYGIILSFLYLISRFFLSKPRTLILVLISVAVTGISGNVFNFFFPYSFGMIYGLSSILISIYFMIKSTENTDRCNFYYLAALFGGLAVCFKYEFVLYIIPLLFFSYYRLRNFCETVKILFLYLFIPFLFVCILFLQGVTLYDISKEYTILNEIMKSKTMWYFYSSSGITFSLQHVGLILLSGLGFVVSMILCGCKNMIGKVVGISVSALFLFLLLNFIKYRFFVFIPVLILLLFFIRFNKIDLRMKLLTVLTLVISVKVFFSLMLYSYGTYFTGILLCVLCILLPLKYRKQYISALCICAVYFFVFSIMTLNIKTGEIKTPRGRISAGQIHAVPFMQTYHYLKKNSAPDEKVLCLPEESMMNYLLERDTDNYLYSVIPMYVEVFGEYHIINRIAETIPEFIVISDWDTSSYYFRFFGRDYAIGIMNYINDNYDKVFETDFGLKHVVYRRKN